jgi:hypothetical protein
MIIHSTMWFYVDFPVKLLIEVYLRYSTFAPNQVFCLGKTIAKNQHENRPQQSEDLKYIEAHKTICRWV